MRPELVAQVRFTEWTDDDKLRHPVYLGLRDDKRADVRSVGAADPPRARTRRAARRPSRARAHGARHAKSLRRRLARSSTSCARSRTRAATARSSCPTASGSASPTSAKIFWPKAKLTKGDLLRYYATVSPLHPAGGRGSAAGDEALPERRRRPAFYQQRSRQEKPPAGVRIETLPTDIEPISEPDARRFIGGSLITLLYMTQIAAISQDPWFSRVQSPLDADYVALDLDPGDGTPFARVLDVARWVHDELESLRCRRCRRRRARAACTSTSRCRRARRTSRACCSARSSRR